MRLWSLSPKYLDQKGLCGVWREGLLAQSCLLKGEYSICPKCNGVGTVETVINGLSHSVQCKKCKSYRRIKTPYYNHPQLERFKNSKEPLRAISDYLWVIFGEAKSRGYKFDYKKIYSPNTKWQNPRMTVTKGQLEYEFEHLQDNLSCRGYKGLVKRDENLTFQYQNKDIIEPHPLFEVVEGDIEKWEKVKEGIL